MIQKAIKFTKSNEWSGSGFGGLPKQVVLRDPRGHDDDELQTKRNLQLRIFQEATRSNKIASFEPGADNRPPAAASYTFIFPNSPPKQEMRTAYPRDWIHTHKKTQIWDPQIKNWKKTRPFISIKNHEYCNKPNGQIQSSKDDGMQNELKQWRMAKWSRPKC